jgi:hypothetical protein
MHESLRAFFELSVDGCIYNENGELKQDESNE